MIAPIKKTLTVAAPAERAFRVFTSQMGSWWPSHHHIGKSPMVACNVEPRVGGRWFEQCEDGSECDWGKVLAWDPPRRLVLAWQLNGQFQYDPALSSEVEVIFTAVDATTTRVEFEHRGLDQLGLDAANAAGMDAGWGQILGSFTTRAADAAAA